MPLAGEEQGQRPKCDGHVSPGPAKRLEQSDLGTAVVGYESWWRAGAGRSWCDGQISMTERDGQPWRVLSSGMTRWTCFIKISLNASWGITAEGKGGTWSRPHTYSFIQSWWWWGVWSEFLHLASWAGRAHEQGFLILCAHIPSATHRESPHVQRLVAPLATSRQEPAEAGWQVGRRKPHSPWTSPDAALSGCLWAWSWGLRWQLEGRQWAPRASRPYFALSWTLFLSEWSLLVLNSSQAGAAMFPRLLLGATAQQLLCVAPREGLLSHCPGSPGGGRDSGYCHHRDLGRVPIRHSAWAACEGPLLRAPNHLVPEFRAVFPTGWCRPNQNSSEKKEKKNDVSWFTNL